MPMLTKPCVIPTGQRPCGGWANPAGTGLLQCSTGRHHSLPGLVRRLKSVLNVAA